MLFPFTIECVCVCGFKCMCDPMRFDSLIHMDGGDGSVGGTRSRGLNTIRFNNGFPSIHSTEWIVVVVILSLPSFHIQFFDRI